MLLEKEIYKKSLYIREFEKLLLSLFDKGLLHGTTIQQSVRTHTSNNFK